MGNPTTTSKNLGIVKALHVGTTAPNNIYMLWADTSGAPLNPTVHKYFDTTIEQWVPIGGGSGGSGSGGGCKTVKEDFTITPSTEGTTFTSSLLIGADVVAIFLDNTVVQDVPFDPSAGSLDLSGINGIYDGSLLTVLFNKCSGNPPSLNGFGIPLGDIVFVSKTGNDLNGVIGDLYRPYNTIQKGIIQAATMSNSNKKMYVVVFPGFYNEDAVLNAPNIDIVCFSNKPDLFDKTSYTDAYASRKRDTTLKSLAINSDSNGVFGIDIQTITIAGKNTAYNRFISISNVVCDSIDSAGTGYISGIKATDILVNSMFNVSMLPISSVELNLINAKVMFNSATAGNVSVTSMRLRNSLIGNASFNAKVNMTSCEFESLSAGNDCFKKFSNSIIKNSKLGNGCLATSSQSRIIDCDGGQNCLSDFTDVVVKRSTFITIGQTGIVTPLTGRFEDVTADYSNGFCNGRPFYGNMRLMIVRATNQSYPCVNNALPVGQIPSNFEYSTFLHCTVSGNTIVGDDMYLSYCKLNRIHTNLNILGGPAAAYNIIDPSLCNYVPGQYCAPPSAFSTTGMSSDGTNITFGFNVTLPVSRAGTQLEITYPNGSTEVRIVEVGNSGAASNISFSVNVTPVVEGNYSFRVRTICVMDTGGSPTSVSSFYGPINATWVTPPVIRETAWEGADPTCEQAYATYSVVDFNPSNGNHKIQRTFDDGLTQFQYNIYCSGTGTTVGPYTVQFNPGQLLSAPILGLAASCFTSFTMVSGTLVGTRIMGNTGILSYSTLQQYYTDDHSLTGQTKLNAVGDPDYIAPATNTGSCPPPNTNYQFRFVKIDLLPNSFPTDYFYSGNVKVIRQSDSVVVLDQTIANTDTTLSLFANNLAIGNYTVEYDLEVNRVIGSTTDPATIEVHRYVNQFIGSPGYVTTGGDDSVALTDWTLGNTQFVALELFTEPIDRETAWRGTDKFCESQGSFYYLNTFGTDDGAHYLTRNVDDGITGFQYNLVEGSNTYGPYTASFAPNQEQASPIYFGLGYVTPAAVIDIIPGSQVGTQVLVNSGTVSYFTLEQYYTDDNTPTGATKPNNVGDPDYIAPHTDTDECPIPPVLGSVRYVEIKVDRTAFAATEGQVFYGKISILDSTGLTVLASQERIAADASAAELFLSLGGLPIADYKIRTDLFVLKSVGGSIDPVQTGSIQLNTISPSSIVMPTQVTNLTDWSGGRSGQYAKVSVQVTH